MHAIAARPPILALLTIFAILAAVPRDTGEPASLVEAQPPRILRLVGDGPSSGDFDRAVGVTRRSVTDPVDLAGYDAVIVSDVEAHVLTPAIVDRLDAYASHGGLLVMAPGLAAGTGAYQATRIEQMMPIRYGNEGCRQPPDHAVVILVDSPAIDGAIREFIEWMSPSDYVGVIGLGGEVTRRVKPQRAANRTRITKALADTAGFRGAPELFAGLHEAREILANVHAARKLVVVASNAPWTAGIDELVADLDAGRIAISTIGLPGERRHAGAALGRYHAIGAPEDAGKILVSELAHAPPEAPTRVRRAHRRELVGAPPLSEYISSRLKPRAEAVLVTDDGEPVLARWCRGKGTVAAWTADLDGPWSTAWVRWSGYARFWRSVLATTAASCE